ncbi:MAG: hypothetical protein IJB02_01670 [Oscillospiraceae bacterium]|nr:hypothetical protein [Oscillospiraceae bacterium]
MERITKFRARILALIFIVITLFFAFKLYDLQIVKTGGGNTDNATTVTVLTRVKASRGHIHDTNGNVLVHNRASYDLTLNHFVLISANGTNDYLYKLVKSCQEAGIEYEEHFPISKERPFVYTLDQYNSAWQNYFQRYLAYLGGLDSDITAPTLIKHLRQRYKLPAEWTEEEVRQVLGIWYEMDLRRCVTSLPLYVFLTDVSDEYLASVMELNVPGMNVEASNVREYSTEYAAHILGYVGPMSAKQWETYKANKDYSMDSEIGQSGLEAQYEKYLHGVDGWREDTFTMDGTLISSHYRTEPRAGSNVEVSIDINLQRAAEVELEKVFTKMREKEKGDGRFVEGGAVVAVEVKTGKVLVCGSNPTYNLATFSEDYNDILERPYDPLFNRALLGTYPPGSTYKMSMVVAAIDSGMITSESRIEDKGVFNKYAGFDVKCLLYTTSRRVHGSITAWEALMVSCNYFFYELGDRIRLSAMDNTAKALGLGEPTGVELREYIGYRANEQTKAELYKGDHKKFSRGDQILAAIGQSDNRFTPMQLAVYTATLANRGTRYKATFLNRVVSADYRQLLEHSAPTVVSQLTISDDAYNAYSKGMYNVAHNRDGTADTTFMDYPIKIAAKTGTAQNGGNLPDNGAFVCYAPFDDPQIAIAIYGEKAGHGGDLAPVAKAILDVYFEVGEAKDITTHENKPS